MSFATEIAKGLGRAYDASADQAEALDIGRARLIIFSDLHRGARDGADDFQRCEAAYNAALAYYFESEHRLIVLGDAEELWECSPTEVLNAYPESLALEHKFFDARRYDRFFGNHDDAWASGRELDRHLRHVFKDLQVREALHLVLTENGRERGRLFFAHGHQGTADSDRFRFISRPVVQHVWRPLQRKLNMASTTPATDWDLRERHESAMYEWAAAHPDRPVVIAGHTHRPIFWRSAPADDFPERAAAVQSSLDQELGAPSPQPERVQSLRAELEYLLAEARRTRTKAHTVERPCYFNTGCCSFGDGDITGIEIADGEIRLVRWPDRQGQPAPLTLDHQPLETVLTAVRPGS